MIFTAYLISGKSNKGDYEGVNVHFGWKEKLKENVDGDEASQQTGKSRKDNINMV